MIRLFLIAVAAAVFVVAAAACSDTFNPPQLPDLGKSPYDFAVVVPPFTGDGGVRDLNAGPIEDLRGVIVDMAGTD